MSLRELHKSYLLRLIKIMTRHLQAMKMGLEDNTVTRDIGKKMRPTCADQRQELQSAKKTQMSKYKASLLQYDHCRVLSVSHFKKKATQDYCIYCKYLTLLEKAHDENCKERELNPPVVFATNIYVITTLIFFI